MKYVEIILHENNLHSLRMPEKQMRECTLRFAKTFGTKRQVKKIQDRNALFAQWAAIRKKVNQ